MTPSITWRKDPNGSNAYVGPHRVASVFYNRLVKRHGLVYWQINFYLPGVGIRDSLNHYMTEVDGRTMAEVGINKWFAAIPRTTAKSDD